jgi:hypothetical protein
MVDHIVMRQERPMRDVTDVLQSYRECVRHLWNASFMALIPTAEDRWKLQHLFEEAASVLFRALVVERLGLGSEAYSGHALSPTTPLTWLHVVPIGDYGSPIMINRDAAAGSGYWDHPITRVSAADVGLRFVCWFDFDDLDFRDFKYYQVRILSSRIEGVAGRAALVECEYARVLLDDAAFGAAERVPETAPSSAVELGH